MKQLVGQVTQKYSNGSLIIWFESSGFGSKYFCVANETEQIQPGDRVWCEFKDSTALGTVTQIKKL